MTTFRFLTPSTLSNQFSSPVLHAGDDRFMEELETALSEPDIPPLVALDELTPRLREVVVNVR